MPKIFKFNKKNRYKSHKKRTFATKIFYVVLLFLCVLVVFNVCDIMKSIITSKQGFFFADRLKISGYAFYGVSVDDFSNEEEANAFAEEISNLGFMGKVYHKGEYFVLAQIYPTLMEALEVEENLNKSSNNARIVSINVGAVDIKFKGENKANATQILNFFKTLFTKCYLLSLSFDANSISKTTFLARVEGLNFEVLQTQKLLPSCQLGAVAVENINLSLNTISQALYSVKNFNGSNEQLSSYFKKIMFNIVQEGKFVVEQIS